jgi:hypothetical protein
MELTIFNARTTKSIAPRTPRVNIAKTGLFTLSVSATKLLKINPVDNISLAKDTDGNWYIYKDAEGFKCRIENEKARFNSCTVMREIGHTGSFLIGGTPTKIGKVEYWGILIAD